MRLRFLAAVGWTILIGVACWTPRKMVENVSEGSRFLEFPNFDKLVHLGIFAVFAVLWLATTRRPRYLAVTIAGLILAVVTELGQLVPGVNRKAGLDDGSVDFLGILVGLLAYRYAFSRLAWNENAAPDPVATEPEAA